MEVVYKILTSVVVQLVKWLATNFDTVFLFPPPLPDRHWSPPNIQWLPEGLSPLTKRTKRDAHHSSASSVYVKMHGHFTKNVSMSFIEWCLCIGMTMYLHFYKTKLNSLTIKFRKRCVVFCTRALIFIADVIYLDLFAFPKLHGLG
jgi:hypothetical protein